ncbi:Sm ribonucleo [Acidianus sulfidivorans JP7]|uniref:Sm ribonucleo n=1 Tax=Acidianus sulfidivorans JP7 TaxID=619593 RepID=A0A2U9IMK4_9CREN|nr:Lsm family RNA-binding protein [Acidianus sulfidivorans]AWR97247.1 Sm ribonucleo [Acidianus sulfidivorans JP7]
MSIARRAIYDINSLLDKNVTVKLTNNRTYSGQLVSFDVTPFLIILSNAKDNENNVFYKVIINGDSISEILVQSQPIFNPKEFADIVQKSLNLRQADIKVYEDAGIVVILEKIKVSENGVEGSGALAQRIYDLFTEYIEKRKKEVK